MMAARKQAKTAGSGSPTTGEPEYLVVGSLRRAHGVHGEIVMEVLTDFPERLKPESMVYIGPSHHAMKIETVRPHGEGLLVKFGDVETPEEAGRYRNQPVYVTTADRPQLPKGQFYEHQVLGFDVVNDANQEVLGTLTEIMRTGANDIYVVKRADGSEVLLPVIPSVVLELDASQRIVRVHLLPGLIDEQET
jgi:16S rRNA processing protein RimM